MKLRSAGAKRFFKQIHGYVMGTDPAPSLSSAADAEAYKAEFDEIYDQEVGRSSLVVYRGFTWPEDLRGKFWAMPSLFYDTDNVLLSFTESRETAVDIARSRAKDGDDAWGFVVKMAVPRRRIWFHHACDSVGAEHPKEKEVIVNPFDLEYTLEQAFHPGGRSAKTKA